MKALNYKKRRKQIFIFWLFFSLLLAVLFACSFSTLKTADKGIALLKDKKARYDEVFKRQAEFNFQLDEIHKMLYSLKNKRRNPGEHKQMQKLITDNREKLEKEIDTNHTEGKDHILYLEFASQISDIQSVMDIYQKEEDKRRHNIEQLEKCKEKYIEVSKQKIK